MLAVSKNLNNDFFFLSLSLSQSYNSCHRLQVRLRSWSGKFLRANGGTPPWRNTVTVDEPHSSATRDWILWDVEPVEAVEELVDEFLYENDDVVSSFASDDVLSVDSEPASPMSVFSLRSPPVRRNSKLLLMQVCMFSWTDFWFLAFLG